MNSLPAVDLTVLGLYLVGTTLMGCWYVRRVSSSEQFMNAGQSLPGWAVGLSIFGSYVSSISFLANPGKSYESNWNSFVFALSLPVAAWLANRYFVPFYRAAGEVSAYHHLEVRFGAWARTYAVVCFMLTQLMRLGTILYLLTLALTPLLGWPQHVTILIAGLLITLYPFLGGTEAVIWLGVVQAVVLLLGPAVCIVLLLIGTSGGFNQVLQMGLAENKFSLGAPEFSFGASTFWVVLLYGMVTNLQNFGIDQAYVQRYITARSDSEARRSVWMGALMYIPVAAAFFYIGTALFVFYRLRPELLAPGLKADAVFPHFITHQLPPGVAGLVLAAICAAAMDSNLNCCATLYLCDIHRRYLRPAAGEAESILVLRVSTLVMGALSTVAAIAMMSVKSALDAWWELAGIFGGGMLGLFLLGMFRPQAGPRAAGAATICGVATIMWMTLPKLVPGFPAALKSPFHPLMVMVVGTGVIMLVGTILSRNSKPTTR